jgi:hypothetical protein
MNGTDKLVRLQKALDVGGGTHGIRDVIAMLQDGRARLWERGDGVVITEIEDYPRLRSVRFWLVAGAMRDCLALQDDVLPWAVEQGCTMATASGRHGWGRVLAPSGWRTWQTMYVKDLGHAVE